MADRTFKIATFVLLILAVRGYAGPLRGGAAVVGITPQRLPVSMTGGFQDRPAMQAHDRRHAGCLVLDDGATRIGVVGTLLTGGPTTRPADVRKLTRTSLSRQRGHRTISWTPSWPDESMFVDLKYSSAIPEYAS